MPEANHLAALDEGRSLEVLGRFGVTPRELGLERGREPGREAWSLEVLDRVEETVPDVRGLDEVLDEGLEASAFGESARAEVT